MEDIIFSVKALAALKNMSIEQLAKECGISVNHLKAVQVGRATMTGKDLIKLSQFTGVPVENIKTE